jgi:Flp pilus assembly pilin Flp
MSTLRHLTWRTEGQDLIEYGVLIALIAAATIAAASALGVTVPALYSTTNSALPGDPDNGSPGNGSPGNGNPNPGGGNPGGGNPGGGNPGGGNPGGGNPGGGNPGGGNPGGGKGK